MTEAILQIKNFSKSYNSQWTYSKIPAVKDLNLEVYSGESVGFLGHNGAGKTSTIKCIVGLNSIDKGEILINNKKPSDIESKNYIGFLPEQPYFCDHLSVYEILSFFASLHQIKNVKNVVNQTLERVNLINKSKSKISELSKGLQQRLGFAQAIINKPKLLILDEPFSGLDPLGRIEMRNLISELNKEGSSIFVSSHILSDVEHICNRVVIMNNGELKSQFHIKDLAKNFGQSYELTIIETSDDNLLLKLRENCKNVSSASRTKDDCIIYEYAMYPDAVKALEHCLKNKIKIIDFKEKSLKLEDVFIKVTQGNKV